MDTDDAAAVNLSHRDLRELPQEVLLRCDHVRAIDLSGNENIQLDDTLRTFRNVGKLDLSQCALTALPNQLAELGELQELYLDRNNFSAGLGDAAGRLRRLKKLFLRKCKLVDLPGVIGDLDQLEELCLDYNDFSTGASPTFGRLTRLKKLSMRLCKMVNFPESIGELTRLEELSLDVNNFSDGINEAIGRLSQLKKVSLRACKLMSLPDSVGELDVLEELNLDHNDFSAGLSAVIGRLFRLKKLSLQWCKLVQLPDSIGNLKQLITMHLNDNKLQDYPSCTLKLKSLRELDLSNKLSGGRGNSIKHLPVNLVDTNLEELYFCGNSISHPPEDVWSKGIFAIKYYMNELTSGKKPLCDDTITIIGEREAGKTSIALSLAKGHPVIASQDDRTMSKLAIRAKMKDLDVSINDFGGLDAYRSVAPLLLPFNSLVICAYDLKAGDSADQQNNIREWLHTVIAKSTKIRLIIVGTRSDLILLGTERSKLNTCMTEFVWSVVNELKADASKQFGELDSLRETEIDGSRKILLEQRLNEIASLMIKLEKAQLCFATVSTSSLNEEFEEFCQLVHSCLHPDVAIPVPWSLVITDILKYDGESFPSRTMEEIEKMYLKHNPEDKQYTSNLLVILKYLVNSSQILWLENGKQLSNTIFHSPQLIFNFCKKVLDNRMGCASPPGMLTATSNRILGVEHLPMDSSDVFGHNETLSSLAERCRETDIDMYRHGKLSQRMLKTVLSECNTFEIDTLTAFMEHFQLLREVKPPHTNARLSQERMFIITSKLPVGAPDSLEMLKKRIRESSSCTCVSLSFIGCMMPLSMFSTVVSAILAAANSLANGHAETEQWRDGLFIAYNGVDLLVAPEERMITLTAGTRSIDRSPWLILFPVITSLQDMLNSSWPGIVPRWHVWCPGCTWLREHGGSDQTSRMRLLAFEEFTFLQKDSRCWQSEKLSFSKCLHSVPRVLCQPISQDFLTTEQQSEVSRFYQAMDRPCYEGSSCSMKLVKRQKLTHRDKPSCRSVTTNGSISVTSVLQENLRSIWFEFQRVILHAHVKFLAAHLYSKGHLSFMELQTIMRQTHDLNASSTILSFVKARGDDAIRSLAEALYSIEKEELALSIFPDLFRT